MTVLEICVDTVAGLEAAVRGGADRVELCAALAVGGLSPGEGLLDAARQCPVPVYAMVRPRAGDFLWSPPELAMMEAEIARVRALGLAGVVLGAGGPDGLDFAALSRLAAAAEGLGRTLHRVVDLLPDRRAILGDVRAMGFERVLTSGGARTAAEGAADIAGLVAAAPQGLSIMPGSGIDESNAAALLRRTGAREVHASASAPVATDSVLVDLGFAPARLASTAEAKVRALRAALDR